MKEIDNKEKKIDTPPVKDTNETAKEAENKKAQFGNSLDSLSLNGSNRNKKEIPQTTESKEAKTDNVKVSEVKNAQKIQEAKKEELGSKLDGLTTNGKIKENTLESDEKKEVYATKIDDKVTEIEQETIENHDVRDSFKDGVYRTVVTNEEITLYRVFGGDTDLEGSYTTTEPQADRETARKDLALLPEWGNECTQEAEIRVPKGTVLNIGKVAEQTDSEDGTVYEGGADQVLLPKNWIRDHSDCIVNIRELKDKENTDD